MKFDPGKSFPHPVLRPDNDDYPLDGFQVEVDFSQPQDSSAGLVSAEFTLDEKTLRGLIERDQAAYALVARCIGTNYRECWTSLSDQIRHEFRPGELAGEVEFAPLVIATTDLQDLKSDNWHQELQSSAPYNIPAGAALAVYPPEIYSVEIGSAEIGSIFDIQSDETLSRGEWICELEGRRIVITMSNADCEAFRDTERLEGDAPEQTALLNGVYLPALVYALTSADDLNRDFGDDCRWRQVLEEKLEQGKLPGFGKSSDRLRDAQRLLEHPFGQMRFIADWDPEEDST